MDDNKILFVDLDGTLIKEDLSNLAFMDYLKKKPLNTLFHLIIFLFKGKPYLKEKISRDFRVPFESLTFNKAALNYVKDIKNRHRVVYLISGSHQILVDQIDNRLKIFFESFGTQGDFNMVGQKKVNFINEKLNIQDFDYFGNSRKDLPIWKYCKRIIYTNVSLSLRKIINSSDLNKIEVKEDFD
jgi:phosphoserine phosphatase